VEAHNDYLTAQTAIVSHAEIPGMARMIARLRASSPPSRRAERLDTDRAHAKLPAGVEQRLPEILAELALEMKLQPAFAADEQAPDATDRCEDRLSDLRLCR